MKTPIAPRDFFAIQNLSDPRISPDGTRIAFVVSQQDLNANRQNEAIHILSTSGGEARRITHGEKKDNTPRWSPDGTRIAFVSNRTGKSQIWLLDFAGGEARQLTTFKAGLGGALWADNSHAWSPCGKWIACISRGNVEDEEPKPDNDMRIVERTFFKWSGGFNPNRPTRVWIIPVDGGDTVQLTDGNQDDHSLSWSPDSAEIAFVSNRTGDWDNNANNDLFAVSLKTQTVRRITHTPGPEFTPAWSPCGKWIACAASDRANASKDSPAGNTEIYVVSAEGGAPRNLSRALDRRAGSPTWSPDGKWIYFMAFNRGTRHVYRVSPEGGAIEPVTRGLCQITGFSLAQNTLAAIRHTERHPAELYRFDLCGAGETALTAFNEAWTSQFEPAPAESFSFSAFDGLAVQGWIFKPIGFDPTRQYPAVLSIHGGPHGAFGYGFRALHHALASAGYGVVLIDPRGSIGYGQAFADGCVNDWGGGDYQDLMLGLDAALRANPWIDPDRLGLTGGSYGGFMTNWIITQTNRFKAGVSHAGLSNHVSFYGTSMFQLLMEYEFGGKPWEVHNAYWHRSPLAHVAKARTPLLLTHGEIDHDVPIGQAEEFYIALKKLGVPATFIRYPREGHGISEPVHLKDFIERHIGWFDTYLKPAT